MHNIIAQTFLSIITIHKLYQYYDLVIMVYCFNIIFYHCNNIVLLFYGFCFSYYSFITVYGHMIKCQNNYVNTILFSHRTMVYYILNEGLFWEKNTKLEPFNNNTNGHNNMMFSKCVHTTFHKIKKNVSYTYIIIYK